MTGPAPARLGMIVAGCVVVAAASGGGVAFLFARAGGGGTPAGVAGVGGGLVLGLAVFAALATSRAISRARGRTCATELVISLVASLSPEDPANWQPGRFRERPALAAFLEAVGGDLARMRARLGRQLGLEGELTRLEKAIGDGIGAGKVEGYEHPAVGRVADLVGRQHERLVEAEQRVGVLQGQRQQSDAAAGEVCPLLQESLRWNSATLDRLSVQEIELKRLEEEARELGRRLAAGPVAAGADPAADLVEIQEELAAFGTGDDAQNLVRAVRRIDRAAERGSRLAIRAAAEVSRQGAGEALLPLVQELQDLAADVRAAGALLEEAAIPAGGGPRLEAIGRRLEQVLAVLRNQGRLGQGNARLLESAEAVAAGLQDAVGVLCELPAGFNQQSERLQRAGRAMAAAADREFQVREDDTAADPGVQPSVQIERFNLFGGSAPTPGPVGRSRAEEVGGSEPRAEAGSAAKPAGDAPRRRALLDLSTGGVTEPAMPDRIHDLAEFDAVALEPEAERIHDLAEFGAVPLD